MISLLHSHNIEYHIHQITTSQLTMFFVAVECSFRIGFNNGLYIQSCPAYLAEEVRQMSAGFYHEVVEKVDTEQSLGWQRDHLAPMYQEMWQVLHNILKIFLNSMA